MKIKILATLGLVSLFTVTTASANSFCSKHQGHQQQNRDAKLFQQMDSNHDGVVFWQEAQQNRQQNFEAADADHDGILSLQEFKEMKEKKRAARLQKKWQKMDANGDGSVSKEEFINRSFIFNRLDRNHDGWITPWEAQGFHQNRVQNRGQYGVNPNQQNQGGWQGPGYPPWGGYGPMNGQMPPSWNGPNRGYRPNHR